MAFSAIAAVSSHAATLLEFDFSGSTSAATSNSQNSTFNAAFIQPTTMIRGAGISNNNAGNSFRGTGFSNNGIATTNTDFFEFALTATGTNKFSVESITGNFNGTSTFSASPGVTMAYAYSLDSGATFTLLDTFTRIGSGVSTYTLTAPQAAVLTDVDSVVFRFYASGQTTTGGWGLQSATTPGTIGLSVQGIPEPSSALLGGLGLLALLRRRR